LAALCGRREEWRFDLARLLRPFTRCLASNQPLVLASAAEIRERVPSAVALAYSEFQVCRRCRRVYWKGSHYRRMSEWIATLQAPHLRSSRSSP